MIQYSDFTLAYSSSTDPDLLAAPVLDGIDATIDEGDLVLVIGRTGCGKTTLLRTLNGLVPYFSGGYVSGELTIAGRSIRNCRPRDLAETVGFVGQNPVLGFVTDRVEDEIVYGLEQLGLDPRAMRKRVEETLDLMGIAELRDRALMELSGGQQQRVAIASVLAAQPRIVVLDEPTSALDPTVAHDVLSAITTLVEEVGLTVVLAEHRLERVMHVADKIIWLPGDGSLEMGDPANILNRCDITPPLTTFSRAMGWDGVETTVRDSRRRLRREHIEVSARPTPPVPTSDEIVLGVENLTVTYGDLTAVDSIDLDVYAGQIVAVMGRNGSGKSSLLWALQTVQPSRGRIEIDGKDPHRLTATQLAAVISMVPQSANDLLYLPTVARELEQADKESGVEAGSAAGVLESLGAHLDPDANPLDLSEGQRLALVLAIQLAARPRVLLLDEPTRGLDYSMKAELARIVRHFKDQGTTVLIATHDVEFAAHTCERVVLMAQGEIIADGTTREILTSSPSFAPQVAKICFPAQVLTIDELDRFAAIPSKGREESPSPDHQDRGARCD